MKRPDSSEAEELNLGTDDIPSQEISEPEPAAADIRNHRIAEAAYYRAEARGFSSGNELEDWLEAEAEIDRSFPYSETGFMQD